MSDRTAQQAAIRRATLAAQREVVALDSASLNELEQIYRQAAADIAQRIAAHSGADGNVALQEMQSVLDQVNARLRALAEQRNTLLNGNLAAAAALGTQPLVAEAALSSAAAMQVNHEALQFVRTFVASDGLQLSDRIWRLDRHARDAVTNAIEMAVIQGHGAAQAARDFLARGEPVPIELQDKIGAASSAGIAKDTTDALLTGQGSPMDNAMRLMRTEINRAHGEAYIKGALSHPDAAGVRFKLSPGHPKPDICDLHSTANLYGLGAGVYPTRENCPWPAHPNTISFVEVVFGDEVTEADKAGKETPTQALERLTPAQRIGVLGKNKAEAFKDGKLTQGMIKTPWREVKGRIERASIDPGRKKVEIVRETEKAVLVKDKSGKEGWLQKRWLRPDGTVSKDTFDKATSELKARNEEFQSARDFKNGFHEYGFVKETEKAVGLEVVGEIPNLETSFKRIIWIPKSVMRDGKVPGWIIEKKIAEMKDAFPRTDIMVESIGGHAGTKGKK